MFHLASEPEPRYFSLVAIDTDDVALDFFRDLYESTHRWLVREGYSNVPADENVLVAYFESQIRRVRDRPRKIFVSSSVVIPQEHLAGYRMLRDRIERGESLLPHMHKAVLDLGRRNPDPLLFHWGLHHLHLGSSFEPNGSRFVRRTGPVIFVWFEPEEAYFIRIAQHGRTCPTVWHERELIEIVHREWPHLTHTFRADCFTDEGPTTTEEIAAMRKGRFTSLLTLSDGTVLLPPGGATAMSGNSTIAGRYADALLRQIYALEQRFASTIGSVRGSYVLKGVLVPTPARVKLVAIPHEIPFVSIPVSGGGSLRRPVADMFSWPEYDSGRW